MYTESDFYFKRKFFSVWSLLLFVLLYGLTACSSETKLTFPPLTPITDTASVSIPTISIPTISIPTMNPIMPTSTVELSSDIVETPTAIPTTTSEHSPTIPIATIAPTTSLPITPTTVNEVAAPILHRVVGGDTLSKVAARYNTTVVALKAANNLTDDTIYLDQVLTIPNSSTVQIPTSSPTDLSTVDNEPTQQVSVPEDDPLPAAIQQFSTLEGNLNIAYPASIPTERFVLHYPFNTIPAQNPQALVDIVLQALTHHERLLNTYLTGDFDVYVAGNLFAAPDQALRGRSFSVHRRFFFLHDGTGNFADMKYIASHELAHTFTWNTFGAPSSVMLHEGIAVYVGMEFIADSGHLPITTFCTAYQQANALPRLSANPNFWGHIRDLENYYVAGCFVKYLVENYGSDKFARLYHLGDYQGIYGRSLADLEAEWQADMASSEITLPFEPDEYVNLVNSLKAAYTNLFQNFTGEPSDVAAYYKLDAARIALLEGRIQAVQEYFR